MSHHLFSPLRYDWKDPLHLRGDSSPSPSPSPSPSDWLEGWISRQQDIRLSFVQKVLMPLSQEIVDNAGMVFNQLVADGSQEYLLRKMVQLQLQVECEEPRGAYHRCRERDVYKKQLLFEIYQLFTSFFIRCSGTISDAPNEPQHGNFSLKLHGSSLLRFHDSEIQWSAFPLLPEDSITHITLSFIPVDDLHISINLAESPSSLPITIDLATLTYSQGDDALHLPYSTLCPAFDKRANHVVTVHVYLDTLIGFCWIVNEQGKVAGGVLDHLPSPLFLGISADPLPSGIELARVPSKPSEYSIPFLEYSRNRLHQLLHSEITFFSSHQSGESSNIVRFYGKQMPFLLTYYTLLRIGNETPPVSLSPSLLYDLMEDLHIRKETVRLFPDLFSGHDKIGITTLTENGVFKDGEVSLFIEEGKARLWLDDWIEGKLHSFGWVFVNMPVCAVAVLGYQGVEVIVVDLHRLVITRRFCLKEKEKRMDTLQGFRSVSLFVDSVQWSITRLVNQAKRISPTEHTSNLNDQDLWYVQLFPLFHNGWSRELRSICWDEVFQETSHKSYLLQYAANPEKVVRRLPIRCEDSTLLKHVQRIDSMWRPTQHEIIIEESEKPSFLLNPSRAFYPITRAIYQQLIALLEFHSRFENGAEVSQAANNLMRFINDLRTRQGKKWADLEDLPDRLKVVLKRIFPANLSVSTCQKCLQVLLTHLDSLHTLFSPFHDYHMMTLRALFAFELDTMDFWVDVAPLPFSVNYESSILSRFITQRLLSVMDSVTIIQSFRLLLNALRLFYCDSLRSLVCKRLFKWEFQPENEVTVETIEILFLSLQLVECIIDRKGDDEPLFDWLLRITHQLKLVHTFSLDGHDISLDGFFSLWIHRVCFAFLYSSCLTHNHLKSFIELISLPLRHEDCVFVTSTLTLLTKKGTLNSLMEFVIFMGFHL